MPLKIKNIDFSCASPSSTAICSSTNQHSMVKNTTKSSFNRLNSYLNDHYKTFTNNNNHQYSFSPRAPCINELPFTPRLSSSYREKTPKHKPSSIIKPSDLTPRRKSSADIADIGRRYREKSGYTSVLGSPPRGNSSRYLLGESRFLDSLSENNNNNVITKNSNKCAKNSKHGDAWALVPSTPIVSSEETSCEKKSFGSYLDNENDNKKINKSLALVNPSGQRVINSSKCNGDGLNLQKEKSNLGYSKNDSIVLKKVSSGSIRTRDQVVVLRVSLHCRGCEGKLRKHLSKMEGVTSFSIDLETKKVTVIGNVTPLDVLTSISKVKNAQFWPSQASASPSSSSSSSTSSTLDFN